MDSAFSFVNTRQVQDTVAVSYAQFLTEDRIRTTVLPCLKPLAVQHGFELMLI